MEINNYAICKHFHAKSGKCQWMVNVSIWIYRNMPINANCTKWAFTSNSDSPATMALYQSSVLLPEPKWTQHSSRRLFSSHAWNGFLTAGLSDGWIIAQSVGCLWFAVESVSVRFDMGYERCIDPWKNITPMDAIAMGLSQSLLKTYVLFILGTA